MGFEVLVTTDQRLKYQQNLPQRRIAVLVLMSANWPAIRGRQSETGELSTDGSGRKTGQPSVPFCPSRFARNVPSVPGSVIDGRYWWVNVGLVAVRGSGTRPGEGQRRLGVQGHAGSGEGTLRKSGGRRDGGRFSRVVSRGRAWAAGGRPGTSQPKSAATFPALREAVRFADSLRPRHTGSAPNFSSRA